MKKLLLFLSMACAGAAVRSQQSYWQQETNYTIDVQLDDQEHSLNGFLKLQYVNHSPDTLTYIWFHLWPNAFKNDRTAFSEQLLLERNTDFYFAGREDRGYINRLDFRINNTTLKTEDHPQYIDVLKIYLPAPLAPGAQTTITTPFHVKLPKNFSRGGHIGRSYQLTQWYPKPAVYDRSGWHPMPYLDQGEFYSEFGSFDVRITVPQDYVVAATGELQDEEEKKWMRARTPAAGSRLPEDHDQRLQAVKTPSVKKPVKRVNYKKPLATGTKKKGPVQNKKNIAAPEEPVTGLKNSFPGNLPPATFSQEPPAPALPTKTLRYLQDKIHDFAWFADKRLAVSYDTIQLASGRTVEAWSFYNPGDSLWKSSMGMIKDAVHFRSRLVGEYPYNTVSVIEMKTDAGGGMEYPTIATISPTGNRKSLDMVIEHEIGHNWFYSVLANNERDYAWMDEGINTYYDNRYQAWKYPPASTGNWMSTRVPGNQALWLIASRAKQKKDQPINIPAANFTDENYGIITYFKTAQWMKKMENDMGQARFDSAMQAYYQQWKFKHPTPDDFKHALQQQAGKDLSAYFHQLDTTGELSPYTGPKKIKPAFLFSARDYQHVHYINWLPVPGYNMYDKMMVGLLLHNISMPSHNFQFIAAPLYAFGSKQLNGIGAIGYTWRPNKYFQSIELGVNGARFSTLEGTDSNGVKLFGGFYKVAPSLRFTFRNRSPLSTTEKWIEWKTFIIGERGFNYVTDSDDSMSYPVLAKTQTRYLNQLTFQFTDYRELYPYDVQLQVQQGDGFYRANATGFYYFNYPKGGGMQVRAFAAKFGYLGAKTGQKVNDTYLYQPKLTAVRGDEDYTYSNYFIGRSEFDGFGSQQIMVRDGGLKLRTDLFSGLQGRSDNWVASLNFNTTLPNNLLPFTLPIRVFADAGTYADAWKKNAATSRFLYVAGLQVTLFKDLLNVYVPVLYSKEFRDNLKTVPEENTFAKKISFSIDIHRFNMRKLIAE